MESPPGGKESFDVVNLFNKRLSIDEMWNAMQSDEERAGLQDGDLPPFQLDFEEQWRRVSAEMETEAQEYSELFSEIVEANKEVAVSQMRFHVSDEDILRGLTDENALAIPPRDALVGCVSGRGGNGVSRKRDNVDHDQEEGLTLKKIKEDPDSATVQEQSIVAPAKPGSKPATQYVFVNEKATNMKKVITLRRGEEIPPQYEMASIAAMLPQVPPELQSSIPNTISLPTLQDLRSRTGRSSHNQPKSQPPTLQKATNSAPCTPNQSSKPIKQLSDLMSSEVVRKSTAKTTVIRTKQRRSGVETSKQGPIISNTPTMESRSVITRTSQPTAHVTSKYDDLDEGPNLSITKVTGSAGAQKIKPIRTRAVGVGTSTDGIPATSTAIAVVQKPSLSVVPLGQNGSDKISTVGFLGCKMCGTIFPGHNDNVFRKHVFVDHNIEINGDHYFDECTITSDRLLRCKKCRVIVLNNFEEHQKICLPTMTRETAFEEVSASASQSWAKSLAHMCGIGNCRETFGRRYELKEHVRTKHKEILSRIIVDPEFRCAQCLQRFDESYSLGRHCASCTQMRPRNDTILEIAKSLLNCDFCKKKHIGLGDSTNCYLKHGIFRCVLCLALFKEKNNFYKHLHTYHGLQMGASPRLLLDCPMCDFGPEKYTVIFPHVVTEHFAPMLVVVNQTPPIAKNAILPAPQNQPATPGVSEGVERSVPQIKIVSTSTITSGGNVPAVKKLPELQPLATTTTTSSVPPGIIINNTSRIGPAITMAPTSIVGQGQPNMSPSVVRTSSSQVYPQNQIIILHPPSATTSRPVSINIKNPGQQQQHQPVVTVGQRTLIVTPTTTAQSASGITTSPAVRQPISGLFKLGSQAVRPPQIGLVRPLSTTTPLPLIIRPGRTTTATSQMRAATIQIATSASQASVIATAAAPRPLITSAAQVPPVPKFVVTTNSALSSGGVPSIQTVNIRSVQIPSGTTTITPTVLRGPTATVARPPAVSSVLTITPAVRTQVSGAVPSTTSAPTIAAPNRTTIVPNSSAGKTTAANNANNTSTITTVITRPAVPPKADSKPERSGSKIVTIGGKVHEFKSIHEKLIQSSKSQSLTQSSSGAVMARHSLPNGNFRVPLPSQVFIAPRRPGATTATADTNQQQKSKDPIIPPARKSLG